MSGPFQNPRAENPHSKRKQPDWGHLALQTLDSQNLLKIIFALLFNALTIANVCGIFIS
nr:MAG TPA: hypothetical protein [Caudoviricetes sp.]